MLQAHKCLVERPILDLLSVWFVDGPADVARFPGENAASRRSPSSRRISPRRVIREAFEPSYLDIGQVQKGQPPRFCTRSCLEQGDQECPSQCNCRQVCQGLGCGYREMPSHPLTMEHHTDKVQAVAWNRNVPEVLLSGSFAHSVVMMEKRAPSQAGTKWEVAVDVESLEWDPHNEHSFVALFRDLKTKHATPKYGLIFHTSLNSREKFIDVAAKTALAIRYDALGDD